MSVDLTTRYLGLELRSPLVGSSSPLFKDIDRLAAYADAGLGAVVLPSIFEEQIEHDEMEAAKLQDFGTGSFAEAMSYFPELPDFVTGPDEHVARVEAAKKRLDIPVIASINGYSKGGWTRYAKLFQDAGADALELNIYHIVTDPDAKSGQVEQQYLDLVKQVDDAIDIPFAVKIGPYFSSPVNFARKLEGAGADGLVLFNRFMQPDIDLDTLDVRPNVQLSSSYELGLPVRWCAILHGRVGLSLAASSGIHTGDDLAKVLLAGADCGMAASALLLEGLEAVPAILNGLSGWMAANEYESVEQLKGSLSQQNCEHPEAFERANYMKALTTYTTDL